MPSSASWAGVVPRLAGSFRVITFDDRGHGRSTNPSGALSFEQLADDTVALIEALRLERPFVGGWSDGGEVALQFGLRHPGRARALIAGGTSLELGSEATRRRRYPDQPWATREVCARTYCQRASKSLRLGTTNGVAPARVARQRL